LFSGREVEVLPSLVKTRTCYLDVVVGVVVVHALELTDPASMLYLEAGKRVHSEWE
jgi:hypothetical protein